MTCPASIPENRSWTSGSAAALCKMKQVGRHAHTWCGAVARAEAPGRVRRNMPDPVPVMVLGRLAVDKTFQGRHVGAGLLRDAVLRTVQAAEIAGIRAILVHAISEAAKLFYEGYGFVASPVDPLTVMITVAEAVKILGDKDQGAKNQ